MTNQEIISKVLDCRKGCYVKLEKSKDLGNGVIKISDMIIRFGLDYYNIKENQDKEHHGLPWGEYVEGLEGYVIEHKGCYYLRVYDNGANVTSKSKYILNNVEITKEEATSLVGEKKMAASKKSSCYTIKFDNILSIGK